MGSETARQAGATLLLGLLLATLLIAVGLAGFPRAPGMAPIVPAGPRAFSSVIHAPHGIFQRIADAVRPQSAPAGGVATEGLRERGAPRAESLARPSAGGRAAGAPEQLAVLAARNFLSSADVGRAPRAGAGSGGTTKPAQRRQPSGRVDTRPDADVSGAPKVERAPKRTGQPDRAAAKRGHNAVKERVQVARKPVNAPRPHAAPKAPGRTAGASAAPRARKPVDRRGQSRATGKGRKAGAFAAAAHSRTTAQAKAPKG